MYRFFSKSIATLLACGFFLSLAPASPTRAATMLNVNAPLAVILQGLARSLQMAIWVLPGTPMPQQAISAHAQDAGTLLARVLRQNGLKSLQVGKTIYVGTPIALDEQFHTHFTNSLVLSVTNIDPTTLVQSGWIPPGLQVLPLQNHTVLVRGTPRAIALFQQQLALLQNSDTQLQRLTFSAPIPSATVAQTITGLVPPSPPESILPDPRGNAIFVRGSAAYIAQVESALKTIDRPMTMVQYTGTVYELDPVALHIVRGLTFGQQTGSSGSGSPVSIGTSGNAVFSFPLSATVGLGIELNDLHQQGHANIVQTIHLAVQNGQTGQTGFTQEIPYQEQTVGYGFLGTTYQQEEVGLQMSLTPTVGRKMIRTVIHLQNREIIAETQDGPPEVGQDTYDTVISTLNNQPFGVAGLLTNSSQVTTTGLPPFSNLPLIGGLFKSKTIQKNKSNLFFLLTPHVLNAKSADNFTSLIPGSRATPSPKGR